MKKQVFKLSLLAGIISLTISSNLYANTDSIVVEAGTDKGNIEIANENNSGKNLHISNKGTINTVAYYNDNIYKNDGKDPVYPSYSEIYVKNEKNAQIKRLDIPVVTKKVTLENAGDIGTLHYNGTLHANNILESFKLDEREIKIKNTGTIEGYLNINSARSITLENEGNITTFLEAGSSGTDADDTPQLVENINLVNNSTMKIAQFNGLNANIKNNKGATMEWLTVQATAGEIKAERDNRT